MARIQGVGLFGAPVHGQVQEQEIREYSVFEHA